VGIILLVSVCIMLLVSVGIMLFVSVGIMLFVSVGILRRVVSVSALKLILRYIYYLLLQCMNPIQSHLSMRSPLLSSHMY
jgi:hypothetical protein